MKDDRAAAVQPQDEIARRVRRYAKALFEVLRLRPEEQRLDPVTPAEHLLAVQVAEAITAFERGLRRTPLPPVTPAKDAPAPAEDKPRRARRKARRKPARVVRRPRKARATKAAPPAEG
jgi:hypothetical protein